MVSTLAMTFALPSTASAAAPTNALVKGSGPAVYWVTAANTRYAFPNIQTFWTWYTTDDFKNVVTVSAHLRTRILRRSRLREM